MGLSAAQARLLTITARKSDCEFQSMSLSHQKIALARDMESITDEYQSALNKTKLVYDYYGGGNDMALSYNLLMTPSVYNDYLPKFVTDSTNRIILNSAFANAVRAAGIPSEGLGGTASSDVRQAFIDALAQEGIIGANEVLAIESTPYNNAIGLRSEFEADVAVDYLTYDDLIKTFESFTSNDIKQYGLYLGDFYTLYSNGEDEWRLLSSRDKVLENKSWSMQEHPQTTGPYSADGGHNWTGVYTSTNNGTSYKFQFEKFGKDRDDNYAYFNDPQAASIKFTDLLKNDTLYTFAIDSGKNDGVVTDAAYMQRLLCNQNGKSVMNWMTQMFMDALGDSAENISALNYARSVILDMIWPDDIIQDTAASWDTGTTDIPHDADRYVKDISAIGAFQSNSNSQLIYNTVVLNSENYTGFYTNPKAGISVNLNNIAQVFMTAYVDAMQGMDNTNYSYGLGKRSDMILFNSDKDTDVTFTQLVDVDVEIGSDKTEATFYDAMFNLICTQGWSENERINDTDYMQEMLKNGLIYMSEISEDMTYKTTSYATNKYVQEVPDEDAIAQAEAKYHAAKARIETKENTLDLKMKNLDTEISSLTQEYDTAKSIIKNSIEKSFKRYDA